MKSSHILNRYVNRGAFTLVFFMLIFYGCQQHTPSIKKQNNQISVRVQHNPDRVMKNNKKALLPGRSCCKGYPSRAKALSVKNR